jgi:hypothetical protein
LKAQLVDVNVKVVLGDNYGIAATDFLMPDAIAVTAAVLLSLFRFLSLPHFLLPLTAATRGII